jgi:hypothetical protein
MSGLLDGLSKDFTRRLTIHRHMLTHLNLHPTDRDCAIHRAPLRDTLIACSRCPNPEVCDGWIAQKRPGLPLFCQARESFLHLEQALAPPEKTQRSA